MLNPGLVLPALLAVIVSSTAAVAQPEPAADRGRAGFPLERDQPPLDPVAAEDLFNRAWNALRSDDWIRACELFAKSMELDPAVSTQEKLAECRERDGKLATAWYEYRRALKMLREDPKVAEVRRRELFDFITKRVDLLVPRVPKLQIVVSPPPPGLMVQRNGLAVPSASLGEPIPVDPGDYEIRANAPNFVDALRSVSLAPSQTERVELVLQPKAVSPPKTEGQGVEPQPRAPPPPVGAGSPGHLGPTAHERSDAPNATVALIFGCVGVASLATGAYFGVRTLSLVGDSNHDCNGANDCNPDGLRLRDQARNAQTTGLVFAGTGAVALGTGLILYFSGHRTSGAPPRGPIIALGPRDVNGTWSW